jgi:hypothetical protein
MSNGPQPQSALTVGKARVLIWGTNSGARKTVVRFFVWDDKWEQEYVFMERVSPNAESQISKAMLGKGEPILRFFRVEMNQSAANSKVFPRNPLQVDKLANSYCVLRRTDIRRIMRVQLIVLVGKKTWLQMSLYLRPGKVQDIPSKMEYGQLMTYGPVKPRVPSTP